MPTRPAKSKKAPRAVGTKRTSPKDGLTVNQRAFLAALPMAGGVIIRAAQAAGVCPQQHYRWLQTSEKYQQEFDRANELATQQLEAEAVRRAVHGVERLKFHQGELITIPDPDKPGDPKARIPYVEHDFSDTLLIFMLKAKRPETYRERYEVTGNVDGTLRLELDQVMNNHGLKRMQASLNGGPQ